MSRTDRHRPMRVQVADPYEHNVYYSTFSNRYETIHRGCHCLWHGMHFWRIEENRRRRHADTRNARAAALGDLEAWDR